MISLIVPHVDFIAPCLAAYQQGKERGETWPAKWEHRPSGPVIYPWKEGREISHTSLENFFWNVGFGDGVKLNESLPKNHPARQDRRYHTIDPTKGY